MGAAPIALPRRADTQGNRVGGRAGPAGLTPLRSVRMVSGAMQFTRMPHLPGEGAHK